MNKLFVRFGNNIINVDAIEHITYFPKTETDPQWLRIWFAGRWEAWEGNEADDVYEWFCKQSLSIKQGVE